MVSFQSNGPVPNSSNAVATGSALSDPFITVFSDRDPTPNDFNYPIKKRWINLTSIREWILQSFTNVSGQSLANWIMLSAGSGLLTLSDNVNPPGAVAVSPSSNLATPPNNIQFTGQLNEQITSVPAIFQTIIENVANHSISINPMSSSRWIVDPLGGSDPLRPNGTHTTITSAVGSASSGDTIFVMPGIYTENFTLTAGINLCAYECDALTPNVTIAGTITMNSAGTVSISGIRLQTNGAALLAISVAGMDVAIVNLNSCYLNCTNSTGITFSSVSGSSTINITDCLGDIGTTGIGLFAVSIAGTIFFHQSRITNTGATTTESEVSGGVFQSEFSYFECPLKSSGTSIVIVSDSFFNTIATNAIALTHNGTGQSVAQSCIFSSGSGSCVSIGAGATLFMPDCNVSSTNTNVITGLGTLDYGELIFTGSSTTINTSTTNLIPVGEIYAINGITFDNTSTLSIFSQGTFVPTIRGSGTAGTIAYGTQEGRYQKIGRIVTVTITVSWTTIGAATGAVQCDNLPFTVINSGGAGTVPSLVGAFAGTLVTAAGAVPFISGIANTTTANINYYLGATGVNNASVITASNQFNVQFVYETT